MPEQRPYIYYDLTISLCPVCLKRVYGKIVFEGDKVYMLKTCSEHGAFKVLVSSDVEYYKRCRNYMKKSEMPLAFAKKVKYGCPYERVMRGSRTALLYCNYRNY